MAKTDAHIQKQLNELARRLRKLRQEKGFTNYETFAFDNNFSRSQISRYENGEDLKFSTLVRILDALDTTFEEFFHGFK